MPSGSPIEIVEDNDFGLEFRHTREESTAIREYAYDGHFRLKQLAHDARDFCTVVCHQHTSAVHEGLLFRSGGPAFMVRLLLRECWHRHS